MTPESGKHIVQCDRNTSLCTGCNSCMMMCGLSHNGACGPANGRIKVHLDSTSSMMYTVYACQHCSDHPCYNACPLKDKAMCVGENNIVYINEDRCVGCGRCMKACRFTPSRITLVQVKDRKKRKAKKCDLCRNNPDGPVCVAHCSARVLSLGEDQSQMRTVLALGADVNVDTENNA